MANTRSGVVFSVTIVVKWLNIRSKVEGVANYIECWGAGQELRERFYHWGREGTVEVDLLANNKKMNYLPDARGRFMGQSSLYYQALKDFIDSTKEINSGKEAVNLSADLNVSRTVCVIINTARSSLAQRKTITIDADSLKLFPVQDIFVE